MPVVQEKEDDHSPLSSSGQSDTIEGTPWEHLMGEPSLREFPVEKLKELEAKAEDGNAIAQANWAVVLGKGIGVEQDTDQAVEWFIKAAEQGLDYVQVLLGIIYENGVMVEKNGNEALKWYQTASDQGNSTAPMLIAAMYQTGRDGIPIDAAKTIQWMTLSAERGNPMGQHTLGTFFAAGFGGNQDNISAYAWLDVAYSHGFQLSLPFRNRLLEKMSAEEKGQAEQLATEWKEKYPYSAPMEPIF